MSLWPICWPVEFVGGLFLLYKVFFSKRAIGRNGKPVPHTFEEKLWRALLCFCGLALLVIGVLSMLVALGLKGVTQTS